MRFFGTVAAVATGLVIGLFAFLVITQALSQALTTKDNEHPLHVQLSNGSSAHYYDPPHGGSSDAFAEADRRAAERGATKQP